MGLKEQIREFVKSRDKQLFLVDHTENANVLYEWTRIRSPVRVVLNAVIIRLCKILPLRIKVCLLRLIGIKIGKGVGIAPDVDIDPFYPELISIGDNVVIGWKVNILCHEFTAKHIRLGRVHIGNSVLVGAFSAVRSGVTIGDSSVVAMDSYVNGDIPGRELWGGIPAKRIRKLKRNIP